MSLFVVEPGMATRLVDGGRPSSRSLGVPVGGAADRWSLALGNGLVGNPPLACALEISLKGPTLRAESEIGAVFFGAPFQLRGDRQVLSVGVTFQLSAGEELTIGGTPQGMRGYLCVVGGFRSPVIQGSQSGLDVLRRDEMLVCEPSHTAIRSLGPEANFPHGDTFEVLPGPQASWFDESEFYRQTFTVTPASNRMGIRLQGNPLTMPAREMVSEPVGPGAVQVTRDGQCIVLGVDGQTIGGYPKIAHVIQADLDALGQLRPGTEVRFAPTTLAQAKLKFDRRQRDLREWTARLLTSWRPSDSRIGERH